MWLQKKVTTNFSTSSFVAVVGSGIRDLGQTSRIRNTDKKHVNDININTNLVTAGISLLAGGHQSLQGVVSLQPLGNVGKRYW